MRQEALDSVHEEEAIDAVAAFRTILLTKPNAALKQKMTTVSPRSRAQKISLPLRLSVLVSFHRVVGLSSRSQPPAEGVSLEEWEAQALVSNLDKALSFIDATVYVHRALFDEISASSCLYSAIMSWKWIKLNASWQWREGV